MASQATATLDANDAVCGPVTIRDGHTGRFAIQEVTSTITLTLEASEDGTNWITEKLPDMTTNAAFTAEVRGVLLTPGMYRLIASGVSSGSAVCTLVEHLVRADGSKALAVS